MSVGKNIVVYGEAPESDNEETDSGTEKMIKTADNPELSQATSQGPSLFSLGSPASTIAKFFNYQLQGQQRMTTRSHDNTKGIKKHSDNGRHLISRSSANPISLLHNSLYTKNQQLRNSFAYMLTQPYDKGSKDLQSISQRLVDVQKTLQNVDSALTKLKREQNNLDVEINILGNFDKLSKHA